MPIYPRGTSFMVSVGSGKDRDRATCATLEAAQAKEKELIQAREDALIRAKLAAGRGDSTKTLQDAYTLTSTITSKGCWKGSKGERTTLGNARAMVALFGPNTPITEITAEVIEDGLDELAELGNTGSTINKKLSVLNVMLKEAKRKGWIKVLPDTRRKEEAEQRIYWYTHEEEQAMIHACHRLGMPILADFITLAINTGFRRTELLKLRVDDCYGGVIRLHRGQTKNGDGRSIPAIESSAAIIEKALQAGHTRVFEGLTESTLRGHWEHMRMYLKKANDPKYIVHVLRHTTATRLAVAEAPVQKIMAFMGHRAVQTTMRYIHLTSEHLSTTANLLDRPRALPLQLVSKGRVMG